MNDSPTLQPHGEESAGFSMPAALPTHIEAVTAAQSVRTPLSAQSLIEGGLVPVQTWMHTQKTGNAVRLARQREKQEQQGIRQLNLQAPVELHDLLKSIAKETPEMHRRLRAVLVPRQALTEIQQRKLKCQRAISEAPEPVLGKIEKIIAQSRRSPAEQQAEARKESVHRVVTAIGQKIVSLRGWRRLIVRLIGGIDGIRTEQQISAKPKSQARQS